MAEQQSYAAAAAVPSCPLQPSTGGDTGDFYDHGTGQRIFQELRDGSRPCQPGVRGTPSLG